MGIWAGREPRAPPMAGMGNVGYTWEAAEHGVFYRDSSETVKTELGSSWEQLRQGEELSQLFLPECFSLQGLCKI